MLMVLALALDILLGEPKRWHPLVGFGRYVKKLEQHLYYSEAAVVRGAIAWGLAVIPFIVLAACLDQLPHGGLLDVLALYLAVAYRSLREHVLAIYHSLVTDDLVRARDKLSYIVSRDTAQTDALAVRRGGIESALENGSDAVFAPLFWWLLAGVPGVVIYRLANTLDAMWGYKTPRYCNFGRVAARIDDVLNYIPARLVAISYAALGNTYRGIQCWRDQAKHCASPNAGVVMCAGAGALNITLGGPTSYHGQWQNKPLMGAGNEPRNADMLAALVLLRRTLLLWCVAGLLLSDGLSL